MNTWNVAFASCAVPQEKEHDDGEAPVAATMMYPNAKRLRRSPDLQNAPATLSTSPVPPAAATIKRTMTPGPDRGKHIPAGEALMRLTNSLMDVSDLVEVFSNTKAHHEEMFERINHLVASMAEATRAVKNPLPEDESVLRHIIPKGLLERVDNEVGETHPSLFTAEFFRQVIADLERTEKSREAFGKLHDELEKKLMDTDN